MTRAFREARRAGALLIALVVALGLLGSPSSVPTVRAATPDLTIVSEARYDVQPAQKRVRVTVTLHLVNHLKDTTTKRFYFDKAFIAVMPGASGFKLTGGTGTPRVTITKRSSNATVLSLTLGSRLYSGKSATYTLRFDLVDAGGVSTRDLRIGDALASFAVWAYATDSTPGSSVTVVFPAGYETTVVAGDLPAPVKDSSGRTIYRTGKLATPLTFFAYLVADRPGAYDETPLTTTVNGATVPLTIRAWADDPAWAKRVSKLAKAALPALGDAIGLPWPREDTLVIQEAVSRTTGGYAGLFDPTRGLVDVAYFAADDVVLHEAAHGWFNGSLLADRWANEAFASYYGLQVAATLKLDAPPLEITDAMRASALPLNAWGPVGKETADVEDYAYAASVALAEAIAERAGPDGLRAVWQDASDRVGAYQPALVAPNGGSTVAPQPERVAGPPDWRGLLDLFDNHGTGSYEDLWRQWVARDEDLPLLDDRAASRIRYDAIVVKASDWQLPRPIRDAMRAWRFDDADALMADAAVVLEQRAAITVAAASAGLTPPPTLRDRFQGTDGFADALAEASAELIAIQHVQAAIDARPRDPDLVLQAGLWGATPEVDLAAARTAFARGDLEGAAASADAALAVWTSAADVGQGRIVSGLALVLAVMVAAALVVVGIRGRRSRSRGRERAVHGRMMARPMSSVVGTSSGTGSGDHSSSVAADGAGPYATLAATPEAPARDPDRDVTGRGAGSG